LVISKKAFIILVLLRSRKVSRKKQNPASEPQRAPIQAQREKSNPPPKIGFFEEKRPGNWSMTRLLTFFISLVPLLVWVMANFIKFIFIFSSGKGKVLLSEITMVPLPESVLLLITGGFTLKYIQKKYAENTPESNEGKPNDSQEGK